MVAYHLSTRNVDLQSFLFLLNSCVFIRLCSAAYSYIVLIRFPRETLINLITRRSARKEVNYVMPNLLVRVYFRVTTSHRDR